MNNKCKLALLICRGLYTALQEYVGDYSIYMYCGRCDELIVS